MSHYGCVSAMKADGFPVQAACGVAEVSTSSYYDWRAEVAVGPSAAKWNEAHLVNEMHEIHARLDDTYGRPAHDHRATSRRSGGSCATVSPSFKPHSQLSGWQREGHGLGRWG